MSWMRDPTAETSPVKRARRAPPKALEGLTIGLFDIGKARTPEFLDQVEKRFNERGLKTKRVGTATDVRGRRPGEEREWGRWARRGQLCWDGCGVNIEAW